MLFAFLNFHTIYYILFVRFYNLILCFIMFTFLKGSYFLTHLPTSAQIADFWREITHC